MTEKIPRPVTHQYLIPGTLVRPAVDWCPTCALPSMWEGPIWHLKDSGVGYWGHIAGCFGCEHWTRTKMASPPATIRP